MVFALGDWGFLISNDDELIAPIESRETLVVLNEPTHAQENFHPLVSSASNHAQCSSGPNCISSTSLETHLERNPKTSY